MALQRRIPTILLLALGVGCAAPIAYLTLDVRPEVTMTIPAANASGVDLERPIIVTFSEAIDPSSVDGSFEVSFGALTAPGDLDVVASSSLVFTPTEPLVFAVEYSARVDAVIRDMSGHDFALDSAYQWSFTTRDLVFSSAQQISLSSTGTVAPQIFVASRDRAVAIWERSTGSTYDILSSEFSPTGWSSQQTIKQTAAGSTFPRVVIDGVGAITAAWTEGVGGSCTTVWVARNTGAGWDVPIRVKPSGCNQGGVQLSANANGTVLAVFNESDGTRINGWAALYLPAMGWQAAESVEQENTSAFMRSAGIDDLGNALVVWLLNDGSRDNVAASRYVPGSGWTAMSLESSLENAQEPTLAISPSGYATAIWQEFQSGVLKLVSRSFTPGIGWSSPLVITSNGTLPSVAISSANEVLSVWQRAFDIEAASLTSSGWSTPVKLESSATVARYPRAAIDARGFGAAVWFEESGPRVYAARRRSDGSWTAGTPLQSDGGAYSPEISISASGYGFAIWQASPETGSWYTRVAPLQ